MVISNSIFFILPLHSMQCSDVNPELWWSKSPLEMEAALVSQKGVFCVSENLDGILG